MVKIVFVSVWMVFVLVEYASVCHGNRMTGRVIAAHARQMIGSTKYPYTNGIWDYLTGDIYRGHLFVADVLKSVGVIYPKRQFPATPIYADEWANPRSDRMTVLSMCWKPCMGPTMAGDVVAYDGLVGIATAVDTIIYSSPVAKPPGLIVEVPSKFVPNLLKGVCWRVIC